MRLLLVEDNPADARWVRELMKEANAEVEITHVETLSRALAALDDHGFDAVLLDLGLPDSAGHLHSLNKILGAGGSTPVVVLTGLEDEQTGNQAVQAGAQDYLIKSRFDGGFLLRTLCHAVDRQRLLTRLAREVTLRKQAQEALEEANKTLAERVLARTSDLRKVNRALSMISRCNRSLLHARDEQSLLDEICRLLVDQGGYLLAWVGYAEDDADKSVRVMASAGEAGGYLETLRVSWADDEWGRGPTGAAIRTGRLAIERNLTGSQNAQTWRDAAAQWGLRASVALPLRIEDRVIGTLNIYAPTSSMLEAQEIELLEELAADLSFGIATLRGRRARQEAEAKAQLLSNAIEQTADLVTITDHNGAILYVNAAFEQVTGYTFDEVVGKTPRFSIPACRRAIFTNSYGAPSGADSRFAALSSTAARMAACITNRRPLRPSCATARARSRIILPPARTSPTRFSSRTGCVT